MIKSIQTTREAEEEYVNLFIEVYDEEMTKEERDIKVRRMFRIAVANPSVIAAGVDALTRIKYARAKRVI